MAGRCLAGERVGGGGVRALERNGDAVRTGVKYRGKSGGLGSEVF